MRALTSRRGSLGVCEQHDAALALLDELREGRLGPLVRFDLAAEAGQADGVAGLGRDCARCWNDRLSRRLAIGFTGEFLDGFDFRLDGVLDLVQLGLGRGLLLCFGRTHWRGRGRLALAELDHGEASRMDSRSFCGGQIGVAIVV